MFFSKSSTTTSRPVLNALASYTSVSPRCCMGLSISMTRSSSSSTLSSSAKARLYSFLSLETTSGCCCLMNPILLTSTTKLPSVSVWMLKAPCALVKPNCKMWSSVSLINTEALATGAFAAETTVPLQTVCACNATVVKKTINRIIFLSISCF